jgi:hypothetical protein
MVAPDRRPAILGGAMRGSRLRYLLPLVAALIVLAMGVGSAIAAIPTRNGTYYACLTKGSGTVTLINYPNEKCARGERLIHWNQQGPAGSAGAKGDQGPAGPADWNAIPNKPAGFADGVDNDGVTAVRIRTVTSTTPATVGAGNIGEDTVDCPAGFLAVGGGYTAGGNALLNVFISQPADADTWRVAGTLPPNEPSADLYAQVICLRAEPGGLTVAAKNSDYGPKKIRVHRPDK